ncbi:hypothetical protein FKM82_013439 [Ascaphus truei]
MGKNPYLVTKICNAGDVTLLMGACLLRSRMRSKPPFQATGRLKTLPSLATHMQWRPECRTCAMATELSAWETEAPRGRHTHTEAGTHTHTHRQTHTHTQSRGGNGGGI